MDSWTRVLKPSFDSKPAEFKLRCPQHAIELEAHALRAFADSHAEPDLNPQGDRAERKLRIVLS